MHGNDCQISGSIFLCTFCQSGNDGTGILSHRLVIVYGDCHTCRNGAGRCRQRNRCGIAAGTEVCFVLCMEQHILCNQAAGNKRLCLVICNVDANSCCNLDTITRIRITACVGSSAGDVGVFLICRIRDTGCCQSAGIVDGLRRAGLGTGVIVQLVIAIGDAFKGNSSITDFVQISLNICADSRCGTIRIIAIIGAGKNPCLADSVYTTCQLGHNIGIRIVDCGTGTHRGLIAGTECAGRSQGMTLLFGEHVYGNQFLYLQPCLVKRCLLIFHIIRQRCQIFLFIEFADIQITLQRGYVSTFGNIGVYLIVNESNGHSCVQCDIHDLIGRAIGFTDRHRISTSNCSGLQIVLKHGDHTQCTCGDHTVCADTGNGLSILGSVYIVESKASTDTDTGSGLTAATTTVQLIRDNRCNCRHHNIHADLGIFFIAILINFRHIEEVVFAGRCSDSILLGITGTCCFILGTLGLDFNFLLDIAGSRVSQKNVVYIVLCRCTASLAGHGLGFDLYNHLSTGFQGFQIGRIDQCICGFALCICGSNGLFYGVCCTFRLIYR